MIFICDVTNSSMSHDLLSCEAQRVYTCDATHMSGCMHERVYVVACGWDVCIRVYV